GAGGGEGGRGGACRGGGGGRTPKNVLYRTCSERADREKDSFNSPSGTPSPPRRSNLRPYASRRHGAPMGSGWPNRARAPSPPRPSPDEAVRAGGTRSAETCVFTTYASESKSCDAIGFLMITS